MSYTGSEGKHDSKIFLSSIGPVIGKLFAYLWFVSHCCFDEAVGVNTGIICY